MEKLDLKKEFKDFYNVSRKEPRLLTIPNLRYLMVDGRGDPRNSDYMNSIELLYTTAYTLKFMVKSDLAVDYPVMALEGLWWAHNVAVDFVENNRDNWQWTSMIMTPDLITQNLLDSAIKKAEAKKPHLDFSKVRMAAYDEGEVAQLVHTGPYAEEGPNIQLLHKFILDSGHELTGLHHEIYMSDPRRTAPEKLKTIIRQPIKKLS